MRAPGWWRLNQTLLPCGCRGEHQSGPAHVEIVSKAITIGMMTRVLHVNEALGHKWAMQLDHLPG